MAATQNGWTDYAILQASTGNGKQWKVQLNVEGLFRCNCPSFIFSKMSPKTCKHCKRCEEQRLAEQFLQTKSKPAVSTRPAIAPYWDEAMGFLDKMLTQASASVTAAQKKVMCDVLATKLALFKPMAAAVELTEAVGIRRITFDD